eukprot:scaffold14142_cov94-Isochrysis_galbana.AAC.1
MHAGPSVAAAQAHRVLPEADSRRRNIDGSRQDQHSHEKDTRIKIGTRDIAWGAQGDWKGGVLAKGKSESDSM